MQNNELINALFKSSKSAFQRLPREESGKPDYLTRASVFGLLGGAVNYGICPELFEVSRESLLDETSALFTIAAMALLTSLQPIRALCEKKRDQAKVAGDNVFKGSGGGVSLGVAMAALTPADLFSVLDGGIILATTAGGMLYARWQNHRYKKKNCPHCGHPAKCKMRVCRKCHKIFYPDENQINCTQQLALDWYKIVSFLQKQGLSYLDAELLAVKNSCKWKFMKAGTLPMVKCESFMDWMHNHSQDILDYIDKGRQGRSDEDIDEYLTNLEL